MPIPNRREIRVRPVVRYVVTTYDQERGSISVGEYPAAALANEVATVFAYHARNVHLNPPIIELELSRQLRIETVRGPGQPRPSVRYELVEAA